MPHHKSEISHSEKKRIDVDNPNEVKYWCKKLDCTENELRDAVDAVGDLVEAVKRQLKK